MIYTSYGPNEDGKTTLMYEFIANSDQEAIDLCKTGDISFCDVQEYKRKARSIWIKDEQGKTIYKEKL